MHVVLVPLGGGPINPFERGSPTPTSVSGGNSGRETIGISGTREIRYSEDDIAKSSQDFMEVVVLEVAESLLPQNPAPTPPMDDCARFADRVEQIASGHDDVRGLG